MASKSSFHDLLHQLQTGDEDAASQIYKRFSQQLVGKARGHLDTVMKQKVDPEDLVQSVYRSFFNRFGQGQFELENWESLWGLLITITLRKCGRKIEYFQADKRDVSREWSPNLNSSESMVQWEAIAREPTPEEAAILTETMEQFLKLFNPRQREILSLYLQGYSQLEVCEQVSCSERTVQRVLNTARHKLKGEKFLDTLSE